MTIKDRIIRYLKKKNDWVSPHTFYKLAKEHSISIKEMKSALDEVIAIENVGNEYRDKDTYIKWHNMTPAELESNRKAIEWFDDL